MLDGATIACSLAVMLLASCTNALVAAVVELHVVERQGAERRGEPVTFAVPFPKGELRSAQYVRLLRDGQAVPAQFRVTGWWRPDESIRWLLVDFQADIEADTRQKYTLEYGDGMPATPNPAVAVHIEESDDAYTVDTAAVFRIGRKALNSSRRCSLRTGRSSSPGRIPANLATAWCGD